MCHISGNGKVRDTLMLDLICGMLSSQMLMHSQIRRHTRALAHRNNSKTLRVSDVY